MYVHAEGVFSDQLLENGIAFPGTSLFPGLSSIRHIHVQEVDLIVVFKNRNFGKALYFVCLSLGVLRRVVKEG